MSAALYPSDHIRERLVELGIPLHLHNLADLGLLLPEWCSSYRNPEGLWNCDAPAMYGEVPTVHDQITEADARGLMLVAIYQQYPHYPSLDFAITAG